MCRPRHPTGPVYKAILGRHLHSELAVPLIVGREVIGALTSRANDSAFTTDDERLLSALARQAALSLRLPKLLRKWKR